MPSPYFPNIHLPDVSHNPYFPSTIIPNIDLGAVMQMRAASLAERRAQRVSEEEKEDDYGVGMDVDWDHHGRRDNDDDRRHHYREEDRNPRHDPMRGQEAMEIAHMEMAVEEATRALEDAKQNLREAKIRIKDREREERRRLKERIPRPFVDDAYERAFQQPMRDYLSPAGNRSHSPTPQPSNLRSRSPSPYRISSRIESEVPRQPSPSVQEPRSRSRTVDYTAEENDGKTSASQEQVYQSFNKLHDLAKEFQALQQNFIYPSIFEFQKPGLGVGEVIVVRARSPPAELEDDDDTRSQARGPEGKLAYTRANEAVHTYAYAMEKLLGKLDSVDSWNETTVRARRRGIVGDIEREASKLERYKQKVWHDYLAQNY